MTSRFALGSSFLVLGLIASTALAQGKGGRTARPAPPPAVEVSALTSMPVKELAVFKDGHAFVLHESDVPTDGTGDVVLDTLPTPVIGTFWPYSADTKAKLTAVVAGRRKVKSERTVSCVRDLLEANTGARAIITEAGEPPYEAKIIGIPKQPAPEPPAGEPGSGPQARPAPPPAAPGNVILLQVQEGTRVVSIDRIVKVTFRDEVVSSLATEESRRLLTLHLDWGGSQPAATARIGMVYLQKGVRWIPSYRLDIDGSGQVRVRLQATLINELADLEGATAYLVIGVPSFCFKDTLDPMALQEAAAQLSQYFQQREGQMQQAFSNAMMTQVARMGEYEAPRGGAGSPGPEDFTDPEITAASRNEDLFLFTVKNITLRKGERMVVPVTEFTLTYEDVFALDLPFAPPPEVQPSVNNAQITELARLLRAPKVMHRIRLENKSQYPLTTAPAIILRDGRLLAQSMMTYTAPGAKTDLELTPAVDIQAIKTEIETKRTPEAARWANETYGRIDLAGKIQLTSHRTQPVKIEVTRHMLGAAETADHDGEIVKTNVFEDARARTPNDYPYWWNWYNWPYWWHRFNGIGRITWKFELAAGESAELNYTWYYYWR